MKAYFTFPIAETIGDDQHIETDLPHLSAIKKDLAARWDDTDKAIFIEQINEELAHAGITKKIKDIEFKVSEFKATGTAYVGFVMVPAEAYMHWNTGTTDVINSYLAGQMAGAKILWMCP